MDFTGEDYRLSMLSEETKDLLRNLWVIRGRSLKQWGRFRVFEDIPDQLMQLPINSGIFARFISHRWERTTEPDPRNYQFTSLLPTIQDEEYYWYDYSCIPQNRTTDEARRYMARILPQLNEIVRASKVIIIRSTSDDYFNRGWCFHEWFTAQFTGLFDRTFLGRDLEISTNLSVFQSEIVQAKRQSDRLLCGEYFLLEDLQFTKQEDRQIVSGLTKSAVVKCQKKVAKTCLEVIKSTFGDAKYDFPAGLSLTSDDIHQRFARLVRFIKMWTKVLQPVEPVSDRIAMFFHSSHWEALIKISQPIAVDLLRLEYSVKLREEEGSPVEKELRKVYECCQLKMPEARYAVVSFLCFFLMGYDL